MSETTASQLDKFALYTAAFQEPAVDVAILRHLFRERHGTTPRSLREDFCGSAAVAREWVRSDSHATAVGVDHDEEPLAWAVARWRRDARQHEQNRLRFLHADVRSVATEPVDVLCALNASFCAFKSRGTLVDYLARCRGAFAARGLFVLNVYTGPDAYRVGTDLIPLAACICVWEQAAFDTATYEALNYVHFELDDGSRLERAFTYDWRLWTPPELHDALDEVGFRDVAVHIAQDRSELAGRGKNEHHRHGEWWEAYIVASI